MVQVWQQDVGEFDGGGLSSAEVELRLKMFGKNSLPPPRKTSVWTLLTSQFKSFVIWVLFAAALIAGALGEWVDAFSILMIILLNALLGFYQELRSVRSMESLLNLQAPTCKVIRDGKLEEIDHDLVVPGDLLILEAGDQVAADGRLIQAFNVKVQEAHLTGESIGSTKFTEAILEERLVIGDRANMVFRGTEIITGKGKVVVTGTGLKSEIGKLATLIEEVEGQKTPLQKKLDELGRALGLTCLVLVGIIYIVGLIRGFSPLELLLTAVSLAVAAIPEGLPAVVTITLAIGMERMHKQKALIRNLSAVETLGCTTVICTDKTGTLTENKMRVVKMWVEGKEILMSGHGYVPQGDFILNQKKMDPKNDPDLIRLLEIGALCNSASLHKKGGEWVIVGDPTESALLVAVRQADVHAKGRVIHEIPFDSDRKMMSVVVERDGKRFLYTKGAPDKLCETQEIVEKYTSEGLRVIACAYKEVGDSYEEKNLIFVGLFALQDPPRKETQKALEECKGAGIKVVMITGDHKNTALAIGKKLGIEGEAYTGVELDEMVQIPVEKIGVYARVSAYNKLAIVKTLQAEREVVAMAGDGVNDAPAIEQADIGVAMGKSGSDVTKSVSDMVILDDNFETIVKAVKEGRGIYDNIVKFVSYLFSTNLAEILIITIAIFFLGESTIILAPIHLLWINLITDGFPAVALAMDPVNTHVMKRPPRDPKAPFLDLPWVLKLSFISVVICAITLTVFLMTPEPHHARTLAFTTLVMLELCKPFIIRIYFKTKFLSNPYLFLAVGSSLLLQLLVVYVPVLQLPFKTTPLGVTDWGVIAVGCLLLWGISYPLMRSSVSTAVP